MKTIRPAAARRAFIHPLLLATIAFAGTSGLGVVWARHQITVTATRTRDLEKKLAQVRRNLDELNTTLTAEQSVAALERRNAAWRLGLAPPAGPQVVRVTAADERLFAARDVPSLFSELAPAAPPASPLRLSVNTRARR
jgi:hypothetical protein